MVRTCLCQADCWTQRGMSCCSQTLRFCVCLCIMLMKGDIAHFHFPPLLQIQVPHQLRAVTEGFRRVKSPAGVTSCDIMKLPNRFIQWRSHLAWIANDELKIHCGYGSCFWGFVGKYFKSVHFVSCLLCAFSNSFSAVAVILPQSAYRSSWEYLSSLLVDLPGASTSI